MGESRKPRGRRLALGSAGLILALFVGDRPGGRAVARPGAAGEQTRAAVEPVSTSEGPLIVRGRVELTLEGAIQVVHGAQAKARALGIKENIAVVDQGGHLVAFERMDGARPASGYTAITKATTAATMRQATGPVGAAEHGPDPLLNLSMQNAAQASGGKLTTLKGGVPIVIDGEVAGAVGVGGGTGEQDAAVAQAGVQALLDRLSRPHAKPDAGRSR